MTISLDKNQAILISEDLIVPGTNSFGIYEMFNFTTPRHDTGLCPHTFFCEEYKQDCGKNSSLCNKYKKLYREICNQGEIN